MLTIQKILFLRRVDLFASMSTAELGRIALIAEELVFPAGTRIIREGELGDAMFIVVEGQVRIHRGEVALGAVKDGNYFGEMTLLDGTPRSASATADTDCLVLCIRQAYFEELLASNFEAVQAVLRTLCQRVRAAEDRERALLAALAEAAQGLAQVEPPADKTGG